MKEEHKVGAAVAVLIICVGVMIYGLGYTVAMGDFARHCVEYGKYVDNGVAYVCTKVSAP